MLDKAEGLFYPLAKSFTNIEELVSQNCLYSIRGRVELGMYLLHYMIKEGVPGASRTLDTAVRD